MDIKVEDGEAEHEIDILEVGVSEGEAVEKDQFLLEVATDKVNVEVVSPIAGTITRILVAEGDSIPGDSVLMTVEPA